MLSSVFEWLRVEGFRKIDLAVFSLALGLWLCWSVCFATHDRVWLNFGCIRET